MSYVASKLGVDESNIAWKSGFSGEASSNAFVRQQLVSPSVCRASRDRAKRGYILVPRTASRSRTLSPTSLSTTAIRSSRLVLPSSRTRVRVFHSPEICSPMLIWWVITS